MCENVSRGAKTEQDKLNSQHLDELIAFVCKIPTLHMEVSPVRNSELHMFEFWTVFGK